MPPEEVWAAVPAASTARAARRRLGRRRREVAEVAQRVRRGQPRDSARWVAAQVLRGLGPGREAVREPKAAQPTGCWRAAGSWVPAAVARQWADRRRLPSPRPWPASQCRWRPDAPTDCLQSLCLGPTLMTGASWGCLCPANLKARHPGLVRTARDRQAQRCGTGSGRLNSRRLAAGGGGGWRWLAALLLDQPRQVAGPRSRADGGDPSNAVDKPSDRTDSVHRMTAARVGGLHTRRQTAGSYQIGMNRRYFRSAILLALVLHLLDPDLRGSSAGDAAISGVPPKPTARAFIVATFSPYSRSTRVANSAVRVLIVFCSSFFDRTEFLVEPA